MKKISKTPKISVLMPTYNGEKYIREAIESILIQTYDNFEFLILDDGSQDKSYEIVKEYANKDSRIYAFKNAKNMGIEYSTQKLQDAAKGEYIALMDHDDISLPKRLEYQLKFMENNSTIDMMSCNQYIISNKSITYSNAYSKSFLTNDWHIKSMLLLGPTMINTALFFRRKRIQKLGIKRDPNFYFVGDYNFYVQCAIKGIKFAMLPDCLVKYRMEGQNTCSQSENQHRGKKEAKKIQKTLLEYIGIDPQLLLYNSLENTKKFIKELRRIKNFLGYKKIYPLVFLTLMRNYSNNQFTNANKKVILLLDILSILKIFKFPVVKVIFSILWHCHINSLIRHLK